MRITGLWICEFTGSDSLHRSELANPPTPPGKEAGAARYKATAMATRATGSGDRAGARGDGESVGQLIGRCKAALAALYGGRREAKGAYEAAMRCVVGMLAVLAASEQIGQDRSSSDPLRQAAQVLSEAAAQEGPDCREPYEAALLALEQSTGFAIFAPGDLRRVTGEGFCAAARAMFAPHPDSPIDALFFQTMPLSWIGQAYQAMLALKPGPGGELETSRARRKMGGIYFTPPHLVTYVVQSALAPLVEALPGPIEEPQTADAVSRLRILDPAVGGGDFLAKTVDFLGRSNPALRAAVAADCVFGMDTDPIAVEIARFRVWAAGGYADGASDAINSHITREDALTAEGLEPLDAVLGNPPYIASKNGLGLRGGRGQSDTYLLFLSAIVHKGLVRDGGMLSMVLPDPVLVRGNAAAIRRKLLTDWKLISILHVLGAFPEANVANVVPVLCNSAAAGGAFCAARVERAADQKSFALRPLETANAFCSKVHTSTVLAQPRSELLYLLEDGVFGDVIRRIHGEEMSLSHYEPPFAPLRSLNVRAIYRGEEVGKSAIPPGEEGLPMLLGGQSIQPFEITWEGRRIPESRVEKPRERYARTKILIQKSSPRIIAAVDRVSHKHPGYVFPQSVYAVELREPGVDEYYLLCLLNSEVLREYIWRTVTAYKMVQPQLEIEDIRALPVRAVEFATPHGLRRELASRGLAIFEREQGRAAEAVRFPELDNFAAECLGRSPERSDVVHDVLSHLGRTIVDLAARGRKNPDPQTIRTLEAARAAVETIVWRLYSSQPLQMSLPW